MSQPRTDKHARLSRALSALGFEALREYPGLVASGTLTPECFMGCFEPSRRYFRFQQVFRPLDARGREAKLHTALFEQCQIFFTGGELDAMQFTQRLLGRAGAAEQVEFSSEDIPWEAESIGAKGLGREVFVNGIEVAQINVITLMGGARVPQPACLIAIGMDRLNLATEGAPSAAATLSIHELFELRRRTPGVNLDYEANLAASCSLDLSSYDLLSLLGDLQTEVDFRYAAGIVTDSYRRTAIRTLRARYKAALSRWLAAGRVASRSADKYCPVWTMSSLAAMRRQVRSDSRRSFELSENAQSMLEQIVEQAHRNVPTTLKRSTWAWTKEEFAAVVACEWSCPPDAQHEHARQAQSEAGKGECREQRLWRACSSFLKSLGRHQSSSADMVARYNRLALIESVSFISHAAPAAAASNNVRYLTHWHSDTADLGIARWREKFFRDGTAEAADIEVLCAALTEFAETLVWRLGYRGVQVSSSRDAWRIKRTSLQAIRVAKVAGLDHGKVLELFRLLGKELQLSSAAAERAFADSFTRFSPRVS